MSAPIIAASARSITKSFGSGTARIEVLHGIDIDAYESEILMLLGPSGCGKTTLISILAGTLTPDRGELRVLGEPLDRMKKSAITRFRAHNIGFIFQQFNLIPTISCEENAAVPLLIQGMSLSKALPHARKSLDQVGLSEHMKKRPNQLSGGQQQRVAIARALVHRPALILADEPTGNLDPETADSIMQLLRAEIKASGASAIMVTHSHAAAEQADQTLTLTRQGLA